MKLLFAIWKTIIRTWHSNSLSMTTGSSIQLTLSRVFLHMKIEILLSPKRWDVCQLHYDGYCLLGVEEVHCMSMQYTGSKIIFCKICITMHHTWSGPTNKLAKTYGMNRNSSYLYSSCTMCKAHGWWSAVSLDSLYMYIAHHRVVSTDSEQEVEKKLAHGRLMKKTITLLFKINSFKSVNLQHMPLVGIMISSSHHSKSSNDWHERSYTVCLSNSKITRWSVACSELSTHSGHSALIITWCLACSYLLILALRFINFFAPSMLFTLTTFQPL